MADEGARMAIGSIVINYRDDATNSDICDNLESHDVVIMEVAQRDRFGEIAHSIKDEINERREALLEPLVSVQHLLLAVDPGCYDFYVLWTDTKINTPVVQAAVRQVVAKWRAQGEPLWITTAFEYERFDEDGE